MIDSSGPASFSAQSLRVLRSVGAWMTIAPEKTYVATSIRGLGACKSTYCKAERRGPPARDPVPGGRLATLFALAVAVSGLLSGFAAHRQGEARDMAEPDQLGRGIADCQKSAASVSSGASSEDVPAAALGCGPATAVAAATAVSNESAGTLDTAGALARAAAAGQVGFSGG